MRSLRPNWRTYHVSNNHCKQHTHTWTLSILETSWYLYCTGNCSAIFPFLLCCFQCSLHRWELILESLSHSQVLSWTPTYTKQQFHLADFLNSQPESSIIYRWDEPVNGLPEWEVGTEELSLTWPSMLPAPKIFVTMLQVFHLDSWNNMSNMKYNSTQFCSS